MTGRLVRACRLDPMPSAVVRAAMAPNRIPGWLRRAYRLVGDRLAAEGTAVVGPAYACYTRTGVDVEVEAGYPVSAPVAGDGVVVPSGLPGGPAAVAVHEGSFGAVDRSYRQIERWLSELGRGWSVRRCWTGRTRSCTSCSTRR